MKKTLLLAALPALALGCDSAAPPDLALALDGYEVVGVGVADGAVNAGEAVEANLFVANESAVAYGPVTFTAVPEGDAPPARVLVEGQVFTPDKAPFGSAQRRRVTLETTVPPGTEPRTAFRYTVRATDDSTRASVSFPVEFTTAPLPYELGIENVRVENDEDGDGRLEPGEEASLAFDVRVTTEGVRPDCTGFSFSSDAAEVALSRPTGGPCDSGGRLPRVRFRLSTTLSAGDRVPFTLEASDHLGNEWSRSVDVVVE